MKTVIIASENPVKVRSAELAFGVYFPGEEFCFTGVNAPSDVSEQPIGEEETSRGAHNRLAYTRKQHQDVDYYVAMEGGVIDAKTEMLEITFILVVDRTGRRGLSRTASFPVPTAVADAIRTGEGLGPACDRLYDGKKMSHGQGFIGLLTNTLIDRTELYRHATIIALAQVAHADMYK